MQGKKNSFLNVVCICLYYQETNPKPPSSKSAFYHNMLLRCVKKCFCFYLNGVLFLGDHAKLGRSVKDIFDFHELQVSQKRRSLQRSVIISIPLPLSSQFMANFLTRSFCDRKKEDGEEK